MCLAIPGRIEHIEDDDIRTGMVSFAGVTKEVCLTLVPEASVGDYVIVHVGFAISKVDERTAKESLAMIARLGEDAPMVPGRQNKSEDENLKNPTES